MTPPSSSQPLGRVLALLAALALAMQTGCSSAPTGVEVNGQVLVDGAPLEKGSIVLTPQAGTVAPKRAVPIVNGEFKFTPEDLLPPGRFRVEIYAEEELPFALDDPRQFAAQKSPVLPRNPIAAEFNSQSRLVAELTGPDPQTLKFEVKRARK